MFILLPSFSSCKSVCKTSLHPFLENSIRDVYKKLRVITKKLSNLGTLYVTVKDSNGEKKEISNRKEMEKAITEENRAKYHQSEETCPFLQPPLDEQFGITGQGPSTTAVLQGHYKPTNQISETTKLYLEQCK